MGGYLHQPWTKAQASPGLSEAKIPLLHYPAYYAIIHLAFNRKFRKLQSVHAKWNAGEVLALRRSSWALFTQELAFQPFTYVVWDYIGCNDQQEVCKNFQSVHLLLLPVLGGENADVYKERALPVTADPLIVLRSNRTFSRGAVTSYFSSEWTNCKRRWLPSKALRHRKNR